MTGRNDLDRFRPVADVVDRVPALVPITACTKLAMRDKLIEHTEYISRRGAYVPEIRDWVWPQR